MSTPLRSALDRDPRTLREIADVIGIQDSHLNHYARGTRRPLLANAERIAEALGVPLESLWPGGADAIRRHSQAEGLSKLQQRSLEKQRRAASEREDAAAAAHVLWMKADYLSRHPEYGVVA